MKSCLHHSFALLACGLLSAQQDQVDLKNGDHFVGDVLALSDGFIEIKTPHSDAPLQVLDADLMRLTFATPPDEDGEAEPLPIHSQQLLLRNGDLISGEVMAVDESHIEFQTWFMGTLKVERAQTEAVFFGVTPQTLIYQGPKNEDEWTQGNNAQWRYYSNTYSSRGKGFTGKDLKLPENYIFRTELSWDGDPNLRIHLGANKPTNGNDGVGDAYMIYINSGGYQVTRTLGGETGASRYEKLFSLPGNPSERSGRSTQLELRVNRSSRTIQLYLDEIKVAQGIDPSEPPQGTCVLFESLSSNSSTLTFEDVRVYEWDTTTQNLRLESQSDESLDTLSVRDGDRFSGKVLRYDPADPFRPFLVETPLSPSPVSVPLEECAVIYFARPDDGDSEDEEAESEDHYQLELQRAGGLTLSGIELGEKTLKAKHPWLGSLEIDRRIVKLIRKEK